MNVNRLVIIKRLAKIVHYNSYEQQRSFITIKVTALKSPNFVRSIFWLWRMENCSLYLLRLTCHMFSVRIGVLDSKLVFFGSDRTTSWRISKYSQLDSNALCLSSHSWGAFLVPIFCFTVNFIPRSIIPLRNRDKRWYSYYWDFYERRFKTGQSAIPNVRPTSDRKKTTFPRARTIDELLSIPE